MIRRLREENTMQVKEESKARSTDMSETGQTVESPSTEAIFSQILSNPQLKAILIGRLQSEGVITPKK